MTAIDQMRQRAISVLRRERSDQPIRFCPRCGDTFTAGGARTVFRGDLTCHTPMQEGTVGEAIRILSAAEIAA